MKRSNNDYKIGLSKNPERRLHEIKKQHPSTEIVHKIITDNMHQSEKFLHNEFSAKRQDGEWFSLSVEDVETVVIRKVFYKDSFLVNV